MAAIMFAAPVYDLREALQKGRLGSLNPVPWAVMTGNCLGWAAYGYYTKDPFVLASNMPGLVLSFWLNSGAAKLQYFEIMNDLKDGEGSQSGTASERVVTVRQETLMLRILVVWCLILVWAGWLQHIYSPARIIGLCVNVNLVFFYGAPLEAMSRVIRTRSSEAIHFPTMVMNWVNTTFWMAYGVARMDPIIYAPNGIGLVLGVAQGVLVCIYPRVQSFDLDESNVGLVDEGSCSEENLVV